MSVFSRRLDAWLSNPVAEEDIAYGIVRRMIFTNSRPSDCKQVNRAS